MVLMNAAAVAWFFLQKKGLSREALEGALNTLEEADRAQVTPDQVEEVVRGAAPETRTGGYADDLHSCAEKRNETRRSHILTII